MLVPSHAAHPTSTPLAPLLRPSSPLQVSKENIAKTSRTQQALKTAELELHAARRQANSLAAKSAEVKSENLVLKVGFILATVGLGGWDQGQA